MYLRFMLLSSSQLQGCAEMIRFPIDSFLILSALSKQPDTLHPSKMSQQERWLYMWNTRLAIRTAEYSTIIIISRHRKSDLCPQQQTVL